MPDEKTHADSIRVKHTGAATNGAAQAVADDSLGGYPASTEATGLTVTTANLPANITIDRLADYCGTGDHTLAFPTADTAQLTASGGSAGAAVSISNGETKIVEDGSDTSKFVRISRTSATSLSGTATLTAADTFNNATGMDNVTSAEAAAGDDEYRCLTLENVSASTVFSLAAYLATLGTQRVSASAQLGASGAGTIEISSGTFADWPDSGFARITQSGGTLREIVYYSSRTDTVLTVPAAGRELLGTTAAAGAADDTVDAVPGLRIATYAATTVGTATITGAGLDDLTAGGTQTINECRDYRVQIDAESTPDTFKWSNDGGSTWEATGVAITGAAQTLENGVTVTFGATTGHTATDYWDFVVGAAKEGSDEDNIPSGLTWSTSITEPTSGGGYVGNLLTGEIAYLYVRRAVVVGHIAESSVLQHVKLAFDAP